MSLIQGKQIADAAITPQKVDSTGDFSFNKVILGQTTPTNPADAASKQYVDSVATGLDVKESVRAATTVSLDAAYDTGVLTANNNGVLAVDGVAPSVGERILVKNQTDAAENGIYVVTDAGSAGTPFILTRSSDADENSEVTANMFTFVEEGTVNADSGWVLVSDNPITIGSSNLDFSQFSGAGQITAGAALSKSGNTLDVNVDDVTIEISSDALRVKDGGITNAKIASVAADKVFIADAGSYFTSTNVEDALQELAADINSLPTNSAITDLQDAVGSSTGLAGISFTEDNFVVDNTSLESNIDSLDIELFDLYQAVGLAANEGLVDLTYSATPRIVTNGTSLETAIGALDTAAAKSTDLASTANGKGASLIGIEDAGAYYTGTTVEAALQEIGAQLSGAGTIDTRLDQLEAIAGSTTGLAGIDFTSNHVVTDGTSFEAAISALDAFFGNATTADLNKLHDIASTAAEIDAAVASAHDRVYENPTVGVNGQTVFTLSSTPVANGIVELYINGQGQVNGDDFTVSGTTLTWVSTDFSLETTDKVVVVYDTAA